MGPRDGSGARTSGRAPRRATFRLGEDRADRRQSRLDAYAAAVTVSDAARARYDAALSAYTSAEAHLRRRGPGEPALEAGGDGEGEGSPETVFPHDPGR